VKKNQKLKFKVGDKVRFSSQINDNTYEIVCIDHTPNTSEPYRLEDNNGRWSWSSGKGARLVKTPKKASTVKKITKPRCPGCSTKTSKKPAKVVRPPLKFEVGDRVFCGKAVGLHVPEDAYGTVHEVRASGRGRAVPYMVEVNRKDSSWPVRLWFIEDQVFAPRKFKVGDKVLAVLEGAEREATVEIADPPSITTTLPYYIAASINGERYTKWVGDAKLMPAPTLKFKVGDRVFCGRPYGTEFCDPPVNLVGEVVAVDTRRPSTSGGEYVPYKVTVPGRGTLWFMESELTDDHLAETAPLEICVGDIITVAAGDHARTTDPHVVRNAKVVAINLVGTRKVYLAALPASVGWVAFDSTDTITLVKAGGAK